jgi:ferredoxin/coenzyme F420-reducing hydrogenase delta subunit
VTFDETRAPPAPRWLAAVDGACNRLYGWKYNPLYQSGTLATALLLLLLITGLWLIFFYRVGAPYASVESITARPWLAGWVRAVHRYASDAAIVAIVVHAIRLFAQKRSWGARTMAWVSGVVLLGLTLVSGWTGYVMVLDVFGEAIAREGARMLDALPIFSEPISRAFTGERPLPSAFFFLNLFAHVGIPLGMLVVIWLHTSRLARLTLLPPRRLLWAMVGLLVVLAVVRPLDMAPAPNPFERPASIPADWFYAFWLPVTRRLSAGGALLLAVSTFILPLLVPTLTRRQGEAAKPKSVVDESICVGCWQCSKDCPYEAITMLPRSDGRADHVARVNPDRCVSCGICAGSCPPMGVGPPGRTGRDQLARVREFIAREAADRIVVICCEHGAWSLRGRIEAEGARVYPVDCAGSVHTSVIELLVRSGRPGVLTLACPPRDCWNREGPKWLAERMYEEREAELQARVDRRRVRLAYASAGDGRDAIEALRDFRASLVAEGVHPPDASLDVDLDCRPSPVEAES